ncbi:hypothetical protein B0H14DRAFT_3530728 [Mycena olivaceomarginata]|nr:hypothetical protein B0H14DRAFT_3530728 [Mycena olivaceomarginata]
MTGFLIEASLARPHRAARVQASARLWMNHWASFRNRPTPAHTSLGLEHIICFRLSLSLATDPTLSVLAKLGRSLSRSSASCGVPCVELLAAPPPAASLFSSPLLDDSRMGARSGGRASCAAVSRLYRLRVSLFLPPTRWDAMGACRARLGQPVVVRR